VFEKYASEHVSVRNAFKDVSVISASEDVAVRIASQDVSVRNACTFAFEKNEIKDVSVRNRH
jgi:hypothetical protein